MRKIKLNASILITLTLLISTLSYSQVTVPFKMRYQAFVNGDMAVIANNITNRIDISNSANDAYYNQTSTAKLNDEFEMKYVDIDNDESTFSSSSAELRFENETPKKILYAGLYWSATYKYNSGYQKKIGKFVADDKNRTSFNTIKIKLPNSKSYTPIEGQILYDGIDNKDLKDFAPYAVYADVTSLIQKLESPSGHYTVANIVATQGMLSGGVAAGWTLFLVYEDNTMSGKFITSFDGFAAVTDRSTDILFNGFETLKKGNVTAKIACAALEGDSNLEGDQLLFTTTGKTKDFIPLTNTVRNTNNFFNSSITIENKFFSKRIPDSKNTLGYDTCLITIPNENNTIIGNNTSQATLRLKTSGDRYMMFFTAFNVEVTEEVMKLNKLNQEVVASTTTEIIDKTTLSKQENTIKNTNIDNQQNNSENIENNNQDVDKKTTETIESTPPKPDIVDISVDNFEKGYYIVANVFAVSSNATKFIDYLRTKKINAKFFINKLNKYYYVYISKTDDEQEAINLYHSKVNNTYQDKIWVASVNKNSSPKNNSDK